MTAHSDRKASEMTIVSSFRSFDGSTVYSLADGRAVRHGITGPMWLDTVSGRFVRYLSVEDLAEFAAAK